MKIRNALDQPCSYQIQVKGRLSPLWLDFYQDFSPQVEAQGEDAELITLTGCFNDQAALQGTLQSLYNLGCVLISVVRKEGRAE
jgi:hypothetical protein